MGDGKVTEVEGGCVQPNQHVVVAELRHFGLLQLEAVEALIRAGDDPLLLFGLCRHVYRLELSIGAVD